MSEVQNRIIGDDVVQPSKDSEKGEVTGPGAAWKANEEHVIPHNNIPLVFIALMLTTFLASAIRFLFDKLI